MITPKQYKFFKSQIEKYETENNIQTNVQPEEIQENVLIMSMNDMRDQYLDLDRKYQELQTQIRTQQNDTHQEIIRRVRNLPRQRRRY